MDTHTTTDHVVLNQQNATLARGTSCVAKKEHTHSRHWKAKEILHLVHRIGVLIAAIHYVYSSFSAVYSGLLLLRGHDNPWSAPEEDTLPLIAAYLGDKAIRDSPLVISVLKNSTALVQGTIYLHTSDEASFTQCAGIPDSPTHLFSDLFMRSLYDAVVDGTSHNIATISRTELELVTPIVDCHNSVEGVDDPTSGKFLFLVRHPVMVENVGVLVLYLSNQQYTVPSLNENGPAAVATVQLVHDMRANDVHHTAQYVVSLGYPYEKLAFRAYDFVNITEDGLTTLREIRSSEIISGSSKKPKPSRLVQTACREGFYIKGESEQSNVNNYRWQIESDAVHVVSRWRWFGKPMVHDSWAWVHGVQLLIGSSLLSNLVILCLATYRNFRSGKRWLGDAFVSISNSQLIHGVVVLASWRVDEFWSLHEFAIGTASKVADVDSLVVYDAHMRADLLTLYLTACGLLGLLLRERVDPFVAVMSFHMGHTYRISILQHLSSTLRDQLVAFQDTMYYRNVSPVVNGQEKITPMRFWTTHSLGTRNYTVVCQCLVPYFLMLVVVVVYVVLRKAYRHFYPDTVHVQGNTTGTATSTRDEALTAQKRVLTLFELATGAQLLDRFGVVAEYETCLYVKGKKFASADGIYTTGFLIANGKFLLQTSDFWSIVLMKILRRRYTNIFVYDVNGTTVNETARLVYPHTLSLKDMMNINVGRLS